MGAVHARATSLRDLSLAGVPTSFSLFQPSFLASPSLAVALQVSGQPTRNPHDKLSAPCFLFSTHPGTGHHDPDAHGPSLQSGSDCTVPEPGARVTHDVGRSEPQLSVALIDIIERSAPGLTFFHFHCARTKGLSLDLKKTWQVALNRLSSRGHEVLRCPHPCPYPCCSSG